MVGSLPTDRQLVEILIATIARQGACDVRVKGSQTYPSPIIVNGIVPDVTCRIRDNQLVFDLFTPDALYEPTARRNVLTLIRYVQQQNGLYNLVPNPQDKELADAFLSQVIRAAVYPLSR